MKKIKVSICTGTACFVMGASEIMLLEELGNPAGQGDTRDCPVPPGSPPRKQ